MPIMPFRGQIDPRLGPIPYYDGLQEMPGQDVGYPDIEMLRQWSRLQTPYDAQARFNELYQPQTQATDAYTSLANQYPTRPEPGRLQRIMAELSAASYGGPAGFSRMSGDPLGYQRPSPQIAQQARDQFLYGDFNRNVDDWGTRLKGLEPAMTSERYYNANMRQLANQVVQQELQERRIAETERYNRERTRLAEEKQADIQKYYQAKQELDWMKYLNPEQKIWSQRGGNLWTFNPRGGGLRNTGIPTNTLSDMDRIKYGLDADKELAEIRAEAAALNAPNIPLQTPEGQVYGFNPRTNTMAPTQTTTGEKPPTNVTRIGTPSQGKSQLLSPTQVEQHRLNRAQEFANRNQDLSKWIGIDMQRGTLVVAPSPAPLSPNAGWWEKFTRKDGPTPDERQRILDYIWNDSAQINQQPQQPQQQSTGAMTTGAEAPAAPKVGHIHTWPNGASARWDGTGWAPINGPRK